jgi:hypothetical protein
MNINNKKKVWDQSPPFNFLDSEISSNFFLKSSSSNDHCFIDYNKVNYEISSGTSQNIFQDVYQYKLEFCKPNDESRKL